MNISRQEVRKKLFESIKENFLSKEFISIAILSIVLICSAFAVVVTQFKYHSYLVDYQIAEKKNCGLNGHNYY